MEKDIFALIFDYTPIPLYTTITLKESRLASHEYFATFDAFGQCTIYNQWHKRNFAVHRTIRSQC